MKQVLKAFATGADTMMLFMCKDQVADQMQWPASQHSCRSWQRSLWRLCPLFHVLEFNPHDCVCRLLQRPISVSGGAAQAGLAAGRADAAGALMEGMPAGLRRIAGQAAQLLTSHVSLPYCQYHLSLACASCVASMMLVLQRPSIIAHTLAYALVFSTCTASKA